MHESKTSISEWRLRAALLLFSLAISLIGAEIALRLLGIGAPVERRGSAGFTFFTQDEQLGWDLVPGAVDRFTTDEFDVEVRITEQGLRAPRLYALAPSVAEDLSDAEAPPQNRIVVLGDSFSFGHGVDVDQAWPALLDARLGDDHEVINLSVTGYGTDQQLLRFEQRLDRPDEALRPDTVILGLFVGNIFRNARQTHIGYPKPRFVLDSDGLRLTGVPVPTAAPPAGGPSRLVDVAGKTLRSVGEHLGRGEAWTVTEAILQRLQERCREEGAELVVAVIPKDRAVYDDGPRGHIHRNTQKHAVALVEAAGIPVVDLLPPLVDGVTDLEAGERLYFSRDGHWTAAGHAIAADAVAEALTRR